MIGALINAQRRGTVETTEALFADAGAAHTFAVGSARTIFRARREFAVLATIWGGTFALEACSLAACAMSTAIAGTLAHGAVFTSVAFFTFADTILADTMVRASHRTHLDGAIRTCPLVCTFALAIMAFTMARAAIEVGTRLEISIFLHSAVITFPAGLARALAFLGASTVASTAIDASLELASITSELRFAKAYSISAGALAVAVVDAATFCTCRSIVIAVALATGALHAGAMTSALNSIGDRAFFAFTLIAGIPIRAFAALLIGIACAMARALVSSRNECAKIVG